MGRVIFEEKQNDCTLTDKKNRKLFNNIFGAAVYMYGNK
jgi:hypothetical protein